MPNPQRSLNGSPRLLIVEGYSDLRFYAEYLEHLGRYGDDVFIEDLKGGKNLSAKLRVLLRPDFLLSERKTKIGIIVDADITPARSQTSAAAAKIDSVRNILHEITGRRIDHGLWDEREGQCKMGFFVAPDGQSDGEVETLVWKAWASDPKNSATRQCIQNYVACMKSTGLEAKSPDKGLIHSFTAIANDEDPRLGPTAQTGKFDFNRPEFDPLRNFLLEF